jgi:hypothetical protein
MPIPVSVESKRDARVLAWLIGQVGEQAVAEACRRLAGDRRPYVSNIAKTLGLTPPPSLALASDESVREHLDRIRSILGGRDGNT